MAKKTDWIQVYDIERGDKRPEFYEDYLNPLGPGWSAGVAALGQAVINLTSAKSTNILLKAVSSPLGGAVVGTVLMETVNFTIAKSKGEQYDFFSKGNLVVSVSASLGSSLALHIGRAAIITAAEFLGITAPHALLAASIVTVGVVTGASVLFSDRGSRLISNLNDSETFWIRFSNADDDDVKGALVQGGYSGAKSEYFFTTLLLQHISGNLDGGKVAIYDHNGEIRSSNTYHVYSGDFLRKISEYQTGISFERVLSSGPEDGRAKTKNVFDYSPNKDGDPYLYFSDKDAAHIYAPLRGFSGNTKITDVKVHAVFEGGVKESQKLFGPDSTIWDFEDSYNLVLAKEGQYRLKVNADDTIILGNDSDNVLIASGRNVVILGGDGDDVLRGGRKADVLNGGKGRDVIFYKGGADSIFGDKGRDTADFSKSKKGVTVNLSREDHPHAVHMEGIERIIGSNHDDFIVASAATPIRYRDRNEDGNDTIVGSDGADTFIDATPGVDVYYGGDGKNPDGNGADTFEFRKNFGTVLIGEIDATDTILVDGVDLSTIPFAPVPGALGHVYYSDGIQLGIDFANDIWSFAFNGGEKSIHIENVMQENFPINIIGGLLF